MLIRQILMAVIGLSAGILVAGGLFGFIVELGVIADFADRTHTGSKILLIPIGLLIGIFVGCWAMALAEILNVFPIFIRRLKITKYIAVLICAMALGRGVGGVIYFFMMY